MNPDSTTLDRMAQLSRRYARYSHSLPGLSLALGGVVMFLLLTLPPFIGNHAEVCGENQRSLLALAVAVLLTSWVLAKEWIRQRIYQSLGLAEARNSIPGLVFNRLLAFALALLALAYPLRALAIQPHPAAVSTTVQIYIGLTACFALPWCTLRFVRGAQEGLLWFILSFWGLALVWAFPLWEGMMRGEGPIAAALYLTLPIAYFGGLVAGLVQHFNFLGLAREIRSREPRDE